MKTIFYVIVGILATIGLLIISCIFIGFVITSKDGTSITMSNSAQSPSQVSVQKEKKDSTPFEIISVSTKCTEKNDVWHKYAWKLRIKNKSNRRLRLVATLQWLDSGGFVVDEDMEYDCYLGPHETNTFRGYRLISMPAALQVKTINAKVKRFGF
jgi:hypothetical protein